MSKPLLLVVDDEVEMADYVGEIGRLAGFDVIITTSSERFQQACLSNNPAVIVMDIVMPDLDGIELVEWLSKEKIKVPMIIISGYEWYIPMTKLLSEKNGIVVAGTLQKPFTVESLKTMLNEIKDSLN